MRRKGEEEGQGRSQWGVPDRGVTIAILTLGKGRVPNH